MLSLVWRGGLGENRISDAWGKIQGYGSDGILVMEVYMSGSQQEKDCNSDSSTEKN